MNNKKAAVVSLIGSMIGACPIPLLPAIAHAQAPISAPALPPITQAQRDQMTRSLVAVQTVTLLRDRGLLDERQRERVTNLERELAAALAARDAATSNISAAQTRLELARTQFNAEVATLADANQNLTREIEAMRADTLVQATRLSDEEVRLRQRFADGDTRALDIMDALATQREAAIDLASKQRRAESRRDMARQFAVAVGRGDPGRTSADVLARWDEAAAIDPTDFDQHIARAKLNQTLGRLEQAKSAVQQAIQNAQNNRQRSIANIALGDVLVEQGNTIDALAYFQLSLESSREIARSDPKSLPAQRLVATGLERVASIKARQGVLTEAWSLYQEILNIAREVLKTDADSTNAKEDLFVGLSKLGDIKTELGDASGALAYYQEALDIARELLIAETNSTPAKRRLLMGFRLAETKAELGNTDDAQALCQELTTIAKDLVRADPSSAEAKLDLAAGLTTFAEIKANLGDVAGAYALHKESLDINRELVRLDPSSHEAKRYLSFRLNKIAKLKAADGDFAAAIAFYQESFDIAATLADIESNTGEDGNNLSNILIEMADIFLNTGYSSAAATLYQESLRIARNLVDAFPRSAKYQLSLSVRLDRVADIKASGNNITDSVALYQESYEIRQRLVVATPNDRETWRNLGVSLVKLAEMAPERFKWRQAYNHFLEMERTGTLLLADKPLIAILKQKADAQDAAASTVKP